MEKVTVNFRGETYVADITIDDFKYFKNENPWERIRIKGFCNTELIVPIRDLTLIGPNIGSAAYSLKSYTGKDDIKKKK